MRVLVRISVILEVRNRILVYVCPNPHSETKSLLRRLQVTRKQEGQKEADEDDNKHRGEESKLDGMETVEPDRVSNAALRPRDLGE